MCYVRTYLGFALLSYYSKLLLSCQVFGFLFNNLFCLLGLVALALCSHYALTCKPCQVVGCKPCVARVSAVGVCCQIPGSAMPVGFGVGGVAEIGSGIAFEPIEPF